MIPGIRPDSRAVPTSNDTSAQKPTSTAAAPQTVPAAQTTVSVFQPYTPAAVQLSPGFQPAPLTDAQKAQFTAIQSALPQDAATQGALNKLLVSGKLTSEDAKGNTLLDNLSRLTAPGVTLQGGADPKALLSTVAQELADPSKIQQGKDNHFCGAAAASDALASRQPAEYARVVTGLAVDGQVDVDGRHAREAGRGTTLTLPPGFQANDPNRSLTQQYLDQPVTQLAAGSDERVDANGDGHVSNSLVVGQRQDGGEVKIGRGVQPGTFANQVANMQSDLTGRDYAAAGLPPASDSRRGVAMDEARSVLSQQVAANTEPAVEIGHHWYSVKSMDDQNVTLVDHLGKQSSMSTGDFFNQADAFTYDRGVTPNVAPELSYEGRGGPGGGWNPSAGQTHPGT